MATALRLHAGGKAGDDGAATDADPWLPPLREELHLHPAPDNPDGSPGWTLEDPLRNRFYRIGRVEMEMLARWHLGRPGAVATAITADTILAVDPEQVVRFAEFLVGANLLQSCGETDLQRLARQRAAGRKGWGSWLLHNYLFVRIPLLRPDALLRQLLSRLSWIYSRGFLLLTLSAGLLGLLLALRQWDVYTGTFLHFFSLEGAALAGLTLVAVKLVHEFGHALTAKRYGCRVPTMGVALLVLWPTAYTDTSGAWRLRDRKARLAIGAAGMAAELTLAAWATLLWSFLPDGMLRSAVFMVATTTWILTLAVNLNPLMRFDGYYLLSDFLDIPNLQDRAFRMARWHLRESLFGFGDPLPEPLPAVIRRRLVVFGYATWIYRLFLFLGIALLVYHVFFKLLGLFLFLVEIAWFIARPVLDELREWARRRERYRLNRRSGAALAGLLLLAGLFLVPWRGSVEAPGLLRPEAVHRLHAPAGARLDAIAAVPGQTVAAGQILFRLVSPDLDHALAQADREVQHLLRERAFRLMDRDIAGQVPVVRRQLEAALAKRAGLAAQRARLEVPAPAAGTVMDLADPLAPGEWVADGEWLATVADPGRRVVEAYVAESDLHRIALGAAARFLPEDPALPAMEATVLSVATTASRNLGGVPELASLHGGGIASLPADPAPVPEQAVYRLLLSLPDSESPADGTVPPVLRGTARIDAAPASLAASTWALVTGVLIRESGF